MAMNEKIIKSRVQLIGGTADQWLGKKLLKNEMGIEWEEIVNEDNSTSLKLVGVKIGDGVNTWEHLDYFGGEEAHVFTNVELVTPDTGIDINDPANHIKSINARIAAENLTNDDLHIGDIAVIKNEFVPASGTVGADDYKPGKVEYTAYVLDEVLDAQNNPVLTWVAMDGNYSADNVYFKNDIRLAGAYSSVGNVSKSDGTIAAKGKSLSFVMEKIFTQELFPNTTGYANDLPSMSITLSPTSDQTGEVGTEYNLPTATLKITDVGSYAFGPATGITFGINDVELKQTTQSGSNNSVTNSSAIMQKDSTLELTAKTASQATKALYTDSAVTYTFAGSGDYSDGAIPITNLGNQYEDAKIEGAEATATAQSRKYTGWRYMFAGSVADANADLTSEVIRSFEYKRKSNSKPSSSSWFEFTATGGDKKVYFAYPSSLTGTPVIEVYGVSWGAAEGVTAEDNVMVADARETKDSTDATSKKWLGETAYKVYSITPSAGLFASDTNFRVRF